MSDDEMGGPVEANVLPVAKLMISDCLNNHPASSRPRIWIQGHIRSIGNHSSIDSQEAIIDDGSGCLNIILTGGNACSISDYVMVIGTLQSHVSAACFYTYCLSFCILYLLFVLLFSLL